MNVVVHMLKSRDAKLATAKCGVEFWVDRGPWPAELTVWASRVTCQDGCKKDAVLAESADPLPAPPTG